MTLAVASCGVNRGVTAFNGTKVDPPFTVKADSLASTSGASVSLGPSTRAKKLRLVFFGYTHCPDLCPTVLGSLASGLTKLGAADRRQIQTYFVTTDPKRDSLAVLKQYVERFDPTFQGLSGSLALTSAIGYSMGIYVDKGEKPSSGGYDPNSHSTYVVAVDQHGKAPAFWNAETSPSEFADDLEFLLHGSSRGRSDSGTSAAADVALGWRRIDSVNVTVPHDARVGAPADRALDSAKPVLVNIWASYCGPCRTELPLLESVSQAGELQVIGLSRDTRVSAATTALERAGVQYDNWLDPAAKFAIELDGRIPFAQVPSSALMVDGRVVAVHIGAFADWADVLAGLRLTGSTTSG